MKKQLDKILDKLGLIRKEKHEAVVNNHNFFLQKLGQAAKEKGVKVILNEESLYNLTLDSDLFVMGSRNVISHCHFTGKIYCAPMCEYNVFNACTVIGNTTNE